MIRYQSCVVDRPIEPPPIALETKPSSFSSATSPKRAIVRAAISGETPESPIPIWLRLMMSSAMMSVPIWLKRAPSECPHVLDDKGLPVSSIITK